MHGKIVIIPIVSDKHRKKNHKKTTGLQEHKVKFPGLALVILRISIYLIINDLS